MSAQVTFHRIKNATISSKEHGESRWIDLYFEDDEGVGTRISAFIDKDSEVAAIGEIIKEKEVA